MSTLTYSAGAITTPETSTSAPERKGFWRAFYDALVLSQARRAEREVARYIASHGGLMTDEIEREMVRKLSGNGRRL